MTITLQLKPEIEARLIAQAVLQGVSVEVYLESLIEDSLVNQKEITFSETATYEEWEAALKDLINSPSFVAPLLSDAAVSRESIYTQKLYLIEREHPAYELTMSKILEDALISESSNPIGKGEVHDWLNSLLD